MNELSKFTTDELIEEIKHRLKGAGLKVQVVNNEAKYEYVTGIVTNSFGDRYTVKLDEECLNRVSNSSSSFGVKPLTGAFGSKSMPRTGDKVELKCRITKSCPKFSMFYARITKVIERSNG